MKKVIIELIKYIIILVSIVLIGYLLLVGAYSLPTKQIAQHVEESVSLLKSEGQYRKLIAGQKSTQLDNFTDTLMILNAEHDTVENNWKDSLNIWRQTYKNQSPLKTLTAHHKNKGTRADYADVSYARYWHGYLIVLKPLLLFFNYQQIRLINILIQLTLTSAVLFLIGKRNKTNTLLPFIITLFLLNPLVCGLSLQFSSIYILTMVQFLVILKFENYYSVNRSAWMYHFFVVGILVSYFDLLTYPLVAFGVPITFLIVQYTSTLKDSMKALFSNGITWFVGYSGMWMSKWILATIITGTDIIGNAIESVGFRTSSSVSVSGSDVTINFIEVIQRVLGVSKPYITVTAITLILCLIIALFKKNVRLEPRILVLLVIALSPFVWYKILLNHSYIHYWFTYRELAIFVYALLSVGSLVMRNPQKECDNLPKES